MIRTLLVIVLASSLGLGWPSPGLAAAASNAVRSEADVLKMLNRLVDWSQPSTRVIESSQAMAFEMVDATGTAITPAPESVETIARIQAWRAKSAGDIARLRAEAAALQPAPPELLAAIRSLGPTGVRQAAGVSQVTQLARSLSEDTARQVELMTPLIVQASQGDQQAKGQLARRMVVGMRLMLEGENTMLDLGIVLSGTPDHPQVDLNLAAKASNEALIEAMKYYERSANGEAASETEAASAMKSRLAAAREAARAVWPHARSAAAVFATIPKGDLRTRLETAFATYRESSQVELDIADLLSGAATALETGDPLALDQPGVEALINRRVALINQRKALFNTP
ncbi:MAG: hypothetical protein QE280_05845 [Caulobacter sp.]|nr:hypothetical protein [Caulobacter sp.]